MNTYIFHSVNSGLYLTNGTNGLLADGIHGGPEQGFSSMPAFFEKQLAGHTGLFAHVDGVLFTHLHRDHFQKAGLSKLLQTTQPPRVYGPNLQETSATVQMLRDGICWINFPGIQVFGMDTIHDGTQYQADPHQSFLVCMGDESFFIAGDAALTSQDASMLSGFHTGEVTAGFFNLYQLASPQGQEFIRFLKPERIFLIHLPFKEDDYYHYRSLARQIAKNLPKDLPNAEILPHMSWIDERAVPNWNTDGKERKTNEDAFFRVAQQ